MTTDEAHVLILSSSLRQSVKSMRPCLSETLEEAGDLSNQGPNVDPFVVDMPVEPAHIRQRILNAHFRLCHPHI